MTRSIEECNLLALIGHLISAYMLSDTACFAVSNVSMETASGSGDEA